MLLSASVSLLFAFSANSETMPMMLKDNGLKQPTISKIALADYDLVNLDALDMPIEQQPVHFSQAISTADKISFNNKGYTDVSDEYWFEATGRELMLGVGINISQPGALIRLSGKYSKNQAREGWQNSIDPESVTLLKAGNKVAAAFTQKVSAEQFATANIFPNSSALQLNKTLGAGKFTLKVEQTLQASQRYMVNVKEKNAEHKLHVAIDKQSYRQGQDIFFNADVLNRHGEALLAKQKVSVKLPNGAVQPLHVTQVNKQFKAVLPQTYHEQQRGQLYELMIETEAAHNNIKIKRNGKVAFALNQPTARLEGEVKHNEDAIEFNLNVASEGRYEISGIVYGMNQQGKSVPFMLSRSAYYLAAGLHKKSLQLDKAIIKQSGLQAPYRVKSVQLLDQSRLALLQQL